MRGRNKELGPQSKPRAEGSTPHSAIQDWIETGKLIKGTSGQILSEQQTSPDVSIENKMKCQLRDCETAVAKNIRAMLGHIRVHFQILVPLHLLEKCNTQVPRQSIPRPLRLTFSQVQAHFKIADMQAVATDFHPAITLYA